MTKINTSKASLASAILGGRREWPGKNSAGVTMYWKRRSNKAERIASNDLATMHAAHAACRDENALLGDLSDDLFQGIEFVYDRDYNTLRS